MDGDICYMKTKGSGGVAGSEPAHPRDLPVERRGASVLPLWQQCALSAFPRRCLGGGAAGALDLGRRSPEGEMTLSGAGKGTGVLAGVAAAPLLAALAADPALADMYMPPPLEQLLPPFRGGRAFLLLEPGRYRPVACAGDGHALRDGLPRAAVGRVQAHRHGVHVCRGGNRLVDEPAALTTARAAWPAPSPAGIARAGSGRLTGRLRGGAGSGG